MQATNRLNLQSGRRGSNARHPPWQGGTRLANPDIYRGFYRGDGASRGLKGPLGAGGWLRKWLRETTSRGAT